MQYSTKHILNSINESIKDLQFSGEPETLYEPITYILDLGGKRIRPVLTLMAYNLYQNNTDPAMSLALGFEIFHNFTLLHDDLMDKADTRRGKQTVHLKWDDNTAILSGDAMLTEAYKEITKVEDKYLRSILTLFSTTATEIFCGQQLDMQFEKRLDVEPHEYIEMIRLKTAVLLGCALQSGATIAGASQTDCRNLYDFGINIGLAFQLMDDLLDVYGDPATFGKRIGGDILCNKKTLLLISALKNNDTRNELIAWIEKENYNESEKIQAVTALYNQLDLPKAMNKLIYSYYQKGIACLEKVSVPDNAKKELRKLAEELLDRNS